MMEDGEISLFIDISYLQHQGGEERRGEKKRRTEHDRSRDTQTSMRETEREREIETEFKVTQWSLL